MNKFNPFIMPLFFTVAVAQAYAEEAVEIAPTPVTTTAKESVGTHLHAQIGGGYHGRFISETNDDYAVNFNSPVFSARLIPAKNFALETNYYNFGGGRYTKGSESGPSVFDNSGLEVNFLLGSSLVDDGFFAYVGVGYFSETWESMTSGNQYGASGIQAPIGIGYNFGHFSIDAQAAYRNPAAYQGDVFSTTSDPEAYIMQLRLFANM